MKETCLSSFYLLYKPSGRTQTLHDRDDKGIILPLFYSYRQKWKKHVLSILSPGKNGEDRDDEGNDLLMYNCHWPKWEKHVFAILSLVQAEWVRLEPLTMGWWGKCSTTLLHPLATAAATAHSHSISHSHSHSQLQPASQLQPGSYSQPATASQLQPASYSQPAIDSYIQLQPQLQPQPQLQLHPLVISYPGASGSGRTGTLDGWMMRLVFCLCATVIGKV